MIIVCIAIILLFAIFFYVEKSKCPVEYCEKLSVFGKFLSGGIYVLINYLRNKFSLRLEAFKLDKLGKIHIGQKEKDIFFIYYIKIGVILTEIMMFGLFLVGIVDLTDNSKILYKKYYIEREDVHGSDKNVSLEVDDGKKTKELDLTVQKRKYSKKELEEIFLKAEKIIDNTYLGENKSDYFILTDLNLITQIPEYGIKVEWEVGLDGLIGEGGQISNKSISEPVYREIKASMSYGNEEKSLAYSIRIFPSKSTVSQQFNSELADEISENDKKSESEKYLKLPESVNGKKITYREKDSDSILKICIFILVVMLSIPMLVKIRYDEKLKIRQEQLKYDYPEFVEHFVLLIGAGLNVKGALERMCFDYKHSTKKEERFVYEEMLLALREIENGMSEAKAYEYFGKKTGLLQYMKFCTLVVQNLKKGSSDLLELLEYEVTDSFRERKENAKEMGEKASTKLLMPMSLMLCIVFALILYSAFQGM